MNDHRPAGINLSVRMKLEEINALLCDGFSIIPYPVVLRVHGIDGELRGEIYDINEEVGNIEFVDAHTRICTCYDMTQLISVSDVPLQGTRS